MPQLDPGAEAFLAEAGWDSAERTALAGDMSSRRYLRLAGAKGSAVLMVAGEPMLAFVAMTNWLREAGLSVPAILAGRAGDGLLLLEDFGDRSVKSVLADEPDLNDGIFDDCIALLLRIRAQNPPELARPDAAQLVDWTRLADDHYPGIRPDALEPFRAILAKLLDAALAGPLSVSLRDFHTENMMWLPGRTGILRLGLLDYQDAFLTHPAYDLMSLLTDARTWVPRELRERLVERYIARSGDDGETFRTAFAALSAQRNLRILGIFSRANRHKAHLPRTYAYFSEALEHPAFDSVRAETLAALPPPEGAA